MASEKVALVTGCSNGGIGYFLAQELASRGYKTFATARNVDKMAGLKEAGCTLLQLDVNDQASVDKARDEVLGQIAKDASLTVVNNAGIGHRKPITDVDIEAAKRCYDTNVWAVVRVCQAFTPHMVVAGHGTLINVTSIVGYQSLPYLLELTRQGKGGVNTNITDNGRATSDAELPAKSFYRSSWPDVKERQSKQVAAGTDPEEFAKYVIGRALQPNPPAQVWAGHKSGRVRLLKALPSWVADKMLYKMYGVDLYEKK